MFRGSLAFWCIVLALVLAACGSTVTTSTTSTRTVTMDGYDRAADTTVDPINVWETYQPRGRLVGRVSSGATVTMLQRDGDGVLIRAADGTEGWVTYWFIKELK